MLNDMLGLSKVMQNETVKIGWSDDVWFHDAWFTQGGKEKKTGWESKVNSWASPQKNGENIFQNTQCK